MLSVQNLYFEYPNKLALEDVSFELEKNSITAIVGPNGAGKTTLMRCIAGLDKPFSGTIRLEGVDVIEDPKLAHSKIGYLSDFFGVYEDLTIEQCLLYSGQIRGLTIDATKNRIKEITKLLGLADRFNEKAGNLSRGLRQRLGVAQSIIHSPSLLILDEPASGLDPEARLSLSSLMRELQSSGMTIIVSSHILSELEDYSTAMIVIRDAKLVGKEDLNSKSATKVEIINIKFTGSANISEILQDSKIVNSTENSASIEFSGNEKEKAAILKKLISQKVEVTEFVTHERKMQDYYMDIAHKNKSGKKNEK